MITYFENLKNLKSYQGETSYIDNTIPASFHLFRVPSIRYVRKIFRKTNISNPLMRTRTRAYQGVRNVNFSENFACVLI